jgi:hypothetical protein
MKRLAFCVAISLLCSNQGQAYDSNRVGAAAGRYFGTAVAVDYFFVKTGCTNTRFGMRGRGETAQQFVYNDIRKLLTEADGKAFEGALTRQFISSVEKTSGEGVLSMYRSELARNPNKVAACQNAEAIIFGMLTSAITDFYSAAAR